MSNVHGLRDLHSNQNQGGSQRPLLGGISEPPVAEQLRVAQQHRVLFVSGNRQIRDPSKESYCDMLVFALCPTFKLLSLTTLVTIVNLAFFAFLLSEGIQIPSTYFLEVNGATLLKYGGNDLADVVSGQVYRLVSAMFMHIYFMHIFGNSVTAFMFLSRIEYTFGFVKTLIIYLVAGICGNIFSLACNPSPDVRAGASTALYGIIGIIMGYLVVNWRGLDLIGKAMKCQLWCTAATIIVFIFAFTPSGNVDFYGHLGGFLAGVWLAAIHQPIVQEKREKVIRVVFAGLLAAQIVASFLVVYLS
jgi:rhomboid protease GluP